MIYQVREIANENCDSLAGDVLFASADLAQAKERASHVNAPWGAGIEDTDSGLIDVGFGFGVPCPDFRD